MSKNHPKIYTKHPNGGYGDKQRDLALLNTWPRYWQKGRVKRRQNSLQVYPRHEKSAFNFQAVGTCAFLSPEAAHRLVRTKNHDLCKNPKSKFQGIPVTLRMLRFKSDKSDWFWSQSIMFTNPFKTGMSFDQARGRDSWCWPKGARPLGTRMFATNNKRVNQI